MGSSIGVSPTVTSASEFVNGGGVSRTASTTAKIETAAPIVNDSVAIAAAALAGERRNVRSRCRTTYFFFSSS